MNKNEDFYISLIGEIFQGYTAFTVSNQTIFFKHVNINDQKIASDCIQKHLRIAEKKGLETEEKKVKSLIKEGSWTENKDFKIESLRNEVKNLTTTKSKLFLESQKKEFEELILERKSELEDLENQRAELVGYTAETYSNSRSNDELLRFLIFEDPKLKEEKFSKEEWDYLDAVEIAEFTILFQNISNRITDKEIQNAVLKPFFSMYLPLCEDVFHLYGKPIINLSAYQIKTALYGRMFSNIFSFTEDIPEHIKESPEDLIAFSESKKEQAKNKKFVKGDSDASILFNSTKEDIAAAGGRGTSTETLHNSLKKAGGSLNMEQMMRLAGHDS